MLPKIIALVFSAMVVQAITSFSLTQLLSKAGQRLIAEMRRQVQRHVGLLSVAYYDENRTGTLVARIMSDVEGVRNLVGTGLVEFVGGMLTAVLALFISCIAALRSRSPCLPWWAYLSSFCNMHSRQFAPSSASAAKINAEVTGRLTESLGGVRVIKGYHAEDREASVFGGGVERLLAQRDEVADHDQRARVGLHHRAGAGFGARDVAGRPQRALNHTWTVGDYFQLQHVSRFHDCACLSDREHRHAVD